ncbi:DASH complex subunit Spc19 [Penicillium canariense]|uniref:DASH complex subunit SPC19 n=1 Tax=Penicillium canariense TaxID=189055 RepID=A0A9W9IC10_9EURO|nr:DASH complex subunit Spc19 [Penicillium canariense]KAJ5174789.1 DASH complex subunit Spc19 [Penicillium canariense]
MSSSLASSVTSLQSSLQLLDNSINTLDSGVNDFPRLCKTLQTTRHFELLPEPTLRDAQQSLLDEITPSITHLLSLSSSHVERLARREQGLKAKCDLQEGRLSSNSDGKSSATLAQGQGNAALRRRQAGPSGALSDNAASRALELRRLVQKKERLKYAVDRLELQSTQRERQLRKSMAAQ